MIKFWVRTILGERLSRSLIVEIEGSFREKDFMEYIVQICYQLDIATPIVLRAHVKNLVNFNVTKFSRSDFVDEVDFDALVVEWVN